MRNIDARITFTSPNIIQHMKTPHSNRSVLFCLLLLTSNYLLAAPGNDAANNAVNITPVSSCGAIGGQTLYGATVSSPSNSCGTTYDVWYKFTVPALTNTTEITVGSLGSSLNNTNCFIEVFNASTAGTISITTAIGTASAGTDVTAFNLTAGGTYYFRVFTTANPSSGAANWDFSVCVSYNSAPGNDACSNAVTLTPGTSTTGTVANATASGSIPAGCATGTPDDDVWYKFTAVRTYATVAVNARSALNLSGALLQVFSGACGSLVSVACGKDAVNLTGLTVGQTYYLRVYSDDATGLSPVAGPASPSGAAFNIAVTPGASTIVSSSRMNEVYQQTNLSTANMVSDPWEITYGPDNYLWITEAKGYRVFRMDPSTGAKTTVLDISKGSTFLSPADTSFNMRYEIDINNPQGGLAGLAVHPDFMAATSPQNFVYVSYVYKYNLALAGNNGTFYTNRIVRFTYNTGTGKLGSPVSVCDTLPGSNDHNSQRMIIAPVGGTDYLFYAQGDMGAGQFSNQYRTNKAQDSTSYEGKILRFNLTQDGNGGALDKWIPDDNPYNASLGVQSAVWAIGIRNNQGFAYDTARNILYGSSHGPYSDDEINNIQKYKNYGHPLVVGFAADNNYNGSSAGASNTSSSCPMITSESVAAATINASGFAPYKDPMFSAYNVSQAAVNTIWRTNPGNGGWPSEGWSGLGLYTHSLVPGWKNSLVACSLKWGRLVRMKLGATGTTVVRTNGFDTISYFGGQNRFRDLDFAPNGKDIFVIMDRSTTTSGPSSGSPVVPTCPGCIQKYMFIGYADAAGKSSIKDSIDVAAGTANTCTPGTTISIDNINNMYWVPITGPDGNVMAEIYANGNNLGTVTSSYYTNSGAIRVKGTVHYLDRNITITPQNQPSTPVKVRLYMTKAEYDALDADALSGVTSISSLKILKNNDACGNSPATATTAITPVYAESQSGKGYMLQANNVTSFSSFYFASSNFTLPLGLLTFTGSLQNNNAILLKWTTENEVNTSHFVVERSLDGLTFSGIGMVKANGAGNSPHNYSLPDKDVISLNVEIIYYRLKMVDGDNLYKYSNVISISVPDKNAIVNVSPNPVSHLAEVKITSKITGAAQWKLFDIAGRIVMRNQVDAQRGSAAVFYINMAALAQGTYYLQVSGAGIDKKIKVQKL